MAHQLHRPQHEPEGSSQYQEDLMTTFKKIMGINDQYVEWVE